MHARDPAAPARAVAAAQAVARAHGVLCDEAVQIAAGSNVLVHLRPAPVVARVMTGTAALHDDPGAWLSREVAVAAHLAARDAPVVAPADLLPPGPHERDGLWMTFWRFVAHDPQAGPPDPLELGRSLRRLHAALADFSGDLEPLSAIRDWLARLVDALQPTDGVTRQDLDGLRRDLDALTPTVFESPLPAQALHGDASLSNVLVSDAGLRFNDLEDVCAGPVAWDVAGIVASARDRGHGDEYVQAFLAGYGVADAGDLGPFLHAHRVYGTIWQAVRGGGS